MATSRTRPSARMAALGIALVLGLLATTGSAPAEAGAGSTAGLSMARSAPSPTPDHYTPVTGAKFNNPLGDEHAQRRLFAHIIRTINSVPAREVIRFAVFSFADKATADALLAAYRRGVRVKLIFSGGEVYPPMTRMQRALGTDRKASSFAILCDHSCRGTGGQMHAKFFQFSAAGGARNITMVGSNNLTNHNAEEQWSDLYTVANGQHFYDAFKPWFRQLKRDRPVRDPYVTENAGLNKVDITPVDLSTDEDPVLRSLDNVTCQTREGDIDPDSETPDELVATRLLIAAHAWNGERGKRVAQAVAGLAREGCRVKVFYGIGVGPAVRNILESAGATLRNGTHKGIYTHEKLMIVRGNFAGHPDTVRVWTGSHNWSSRALGRDDLIVQIFRQDIGEKYVVGFRKMWRKG